MKLVFSLPLGKKQKGGKNDPLSPFRDSLLLLISRSSVELIQPLANVFFLGYNLIFGLGREEYDYVRNSGLLPKATSLLDNVHDYLKSLNQRNDVMIPLVGKILSGRSTQDDLSWKCPGTRAQRNLDTKIHYIMGLDFGGGYGN